MEEEVGKDDEELMEEGVGTEDEEPMGGVWGGRMTANGRRSGEGDYGVKITKIII